LTAIAISASGLACASAVELPDSLRAKVFEPLRQQLDSWNAYVSSIIGDKLKPLAESLGGDLQAAINETMGVLGLPDPTQTRKKVEEIGAHSTVPINNAERTANEVDRQVTRAVADMTLGKAGQQRTKEQVEKTHELIQQVQEQAEAAQGEVVTQNVMKQIADQNAQTAAILGAMRADTRSDRTFPTSKPTPTPQIRRAEPVVQYTTPQYPISPRPRVAQQSFPVRQRSVPTVENVALQTVRSAPRNSVPTMQSKQSSSVPQVDPFTKHMPEGLLEQWLAMSRLGSYGSGDTKLQTSFTTATPTHTQSPSALDVQPLPQEVISIAPKATPVVFASEGGTSAMTPQSPSTPPLLPDPNLEKNILTGIPVQQLL